MQIIETHDILNPELFKQNSNLKEAWEEVRRAINATDWPHGAGTFSIYPECGKKRGEGNGVTPIKIPCIQSLKRSGWIDEELPIYRDASVL